MSPPRPIVHVFETGSVVMHEENTVAAFSRMIQECAVNKITKSFLRIHTQNSHVSPCNHKGVLLRMLHVLKVESIKTCLHVSVEQMRGDRTAVGMSSPTPQLWSPPPYPAVQEIPARLGCIPRSAASGGCPHHHA